VDLSDVLFRGSSAPEKSTWRLRAFASFMTARSEPDWRQPANVMAGNSLAADAQSQGSAKQGRVA
jgi:hypothetical protein